MADEKRRIIYELLVEAKGMMAATKELEKIGSIAGNMANTIKGGLAGLAVTFTLKGIAEAVSEANTMQAQLGTLGLTAEQTAAGFRMIEDVSIATGQSMADTSAEFQTAIQITQQLGGTLNDAARAAEAFANIAASEGKNAAAAAEQLNLMNFALQKGEVSAKDLVSMLKSSNVLQGAFESALGKSTQQLIEMAKAGQLGREQLEAVYKEMVKIGEATEVPATLEGITNSLTTLAKSLVNATVGATGFGGAAKDVYGPINVLANILRALATTLGAIVAVIWNTMSAVIKIKIAITQAVLDPLHAMEVFDLVSQQVKEDVDATSIALGKARDAWEEVGTGVNVAGQQLQNEHAAAMRRADEEAKAEEKREKSRKEAEAYSNKRRAEFRAEEAEKEKAARAAEKRERDRIDREQRAADAFSEQLRATREANQELNDYLEGEADAAGQAAGEALRDAFEAELPEFEKSLEASIGTIDRMADVLKDTFSNLFAGGIQNAREFFKEILRGFAQVFAQKAALQAGDWIDKGLAGLLKNWPGSGAADVIEAVPIARGAAFNQGHLMPFAAGGIVRRPTMFAMGGGATGLMGEAGPEAIMPLKRTADGRLGVAATAPMVQIINNTGVAASARTEQHSDRLTIILEAAQMGASMAEERINRSVRTGYGATAQSVQRTYGLTRRM